jgi:transposase
MDQINESKTPIKRRRHSATFKAQVLAEINQPGVSIAAVAQRHGLNANLIHKWRKSSALMRKLPEALPSFIEVKAAAPLSDASDPIVLELPCQGTTIKIHWPVCHTTALANWLKVMIV